MSPMGSPEGKSLKIDLVSQNRLNAIKNYKFERINSKKWFQGPRNHPQGAILLEKVFGLGLGEPYPTLPHDQMSVLWVKSY